MRAVFSRPDQPVRAAFIAFTMLVLTVTAAHTTGTTPALSLNFWSYNGPFAMDGGDLNGDGVRDVVVANYNNNWVSVLLGSGAGKLGFTIGSGVDIPGVPVDLALGDFDNDGRLDLVVACTDASILSVRMGNGVGGFGPARNFPTGTGTRGVAVGDVNLDGRLDMVSCNLWTSTITLYLGDGMGGFAPRIDRACGTGPFAVVIGDFSGDGIPDLVTANNFAANVSLLAGVGDGTFTNYATVGLPSGPVSLALADVTQDGIRDVITVNNSAASVTVIPVVPPGVGTPVSFSVGNQPTDIAVGVGQYVNTTLYVCNQASSSVSVLDLWSSLQVASYQEFATGSGPSSILAYDADSDGQADIVTADFNANTVTVLRPAGDVMYQAPMVLPPAPSTMMAFGDINGDGKVDVATGGYETNSSHTALGNGDGSFGPVSPISLPQEVRGLALVDMNHDGRDDLIATGFQANQLVVRLANSTGTLGTPFTQTAGGFPWGIAIGDVNLDGHPDVVTAANGGWFASVSLGDGAGGLQPRVDYAVGNSPVAVAIGKLNGDNNPDLVVTNDNGGSVSVLMASSTPGVYLPKTDYTTGAGCRGVAIGDVNGDGVNDIVASNWAAATFTLLLGNGFGGFAAPVNIPAVGQPQSLSLADMNVDGRLDIVSGLTGNGIGVYLGNGLGQFGPPTYNGTAGFSVSVPVRDISGDGRPDAATLTYSSGQGQVSLGPTRTKVVLSAPATAVSGLPITLTATVTGAGPYPLYGYVYFFDGTTYLGSAELVNGVAPLSTFANLTGERQLSAIFRGMWERFGNSYSNVVKQRVLSTPRPAIAAITDVKNDQGAHVRLRFNASPFDYLGSATPITSYSIYRRVQPGLAAVAAGGARAAAARPAAPPPGPDAVAILGWDFVTSLPANGETGYEVVVSTLADSNTSGIHNATFFVRAATGTPAVFFDSAPDSGHSVDNLPPAPPGAFLGTYAANVTHLHWSRNDEPDLWYYTIHRGSSAGFTPGPGNLVGTPPDTGYAASGPAGGYFKIAAVDVNGNVSGYAVLTPSATVGVGDDGRSLAFAIEGSVPNPARGGRMSIAFTLPGPASATLELLDVNGRRIASRDVGAMGAGRHVVELAQGRRLAAGVYLVRLSQNGQARVVRTTVLD